MGGGGALGMGKSKSGQQFSQDVWGPQGDALSGMYSQLGDLFGGQNYQDQMQQGTQYSQDAMGAMQKPWEQQMQGGAYQGMDLQQNLMSSLDKSMNSPSAMQDINSMIMGGSGNNYADAMKGQYMQDAGRAQDQMLGNMDARASAAGMSGGARHGVGIGQGMEGINRNLQGAMARTGFETFDKDLDRKLGIAQQADQGTLARQGMLQNMIGGQQNAMSGGIQQGGQMVGYGQDQQMMPWQQAGAYSGAMGDPTVLSSGSGSSKGSNFGMSASGGVKG